MSEPSPDSPFAEFATEKPSAVEYLRARQDQDRRERGENWLLLGILVGTTSTGAATGAALAAGIMAFPIASVLALAGAVTGVLVGWLIGVVTWAALVSQRGRGAFKRVDPLADHLVRGNQWSMMTIWLSAWASLALTVGAAVGGSQIGHGMGVQGEMPACLGGAALGLLGGFVLWFVIRRLRARPGSQGPARTPADGR